LREAERGEGGEALKRRGDETRCLPYIDVFDFSSPSLPASDLLLA